MLSEESEVIEGHVISENKYMTNVVLFTIMWSVGIYDTYMMLMLNKYLEGSIYVNFYMEGLAGIVGSAVADYSYTRLRIKNSFIFAHLLTLAGAILICAFEGGLFSPNFVTTYGFCPKSPYPPESIETTNYYLANLIPYIGFFTKIGINVQVQNAYQGSFSNATVFPVQRRSTAIGICNLVARGCTIFAPIVAEWEKPWPAINLCTVTTFALVASLAFPSKE